MKLVERVDKKELYKRKIQTMLSNRLKMQKIEEVRTIQKSYIHLNKFTYLSNRFYVPEYVRLGTSHSHLQTIYSQNSLSNSHIREVNLQTDLSFKSKIEESLRNKKELNSSLEIIKKFNFMTLSLFKESYEDNIVELQKMNKLAGETEINYETLANFLHPKTIKLIFLKGEQSQDAFHTFQESIIEAVNNIYYSIAQKKIEYASQIAGKFVKLYNRNVLVLYNTSIAYFLCKKYAKSIKLLEKILLMNPKTFQQGLYLEILRILGICKFLTQNAIECLRYFYKFEESRKNEYTTDYKTNEESEYIFKNKKLLIKKKYIFTFSPITEWENFLLDSHVNSNFNLKSPSNDDLKDTKNSSPIIPKLIQYNTNVKSMLKTSDKFTNNYSKNYSNLKTSEQKPQFFSPLKSELSTKISSKIQYSHFEGTNSKEKEKALINSNIENNIQVSKKSAIPAIVDHPSESNEHIISQSQLQVNTSSRSKKEKPVKILKSSLDEYLKELEMEFLKKNVNNTFNEYAKEKIEEIGFIMHQNIEKDYLLHFKNEHKDLTKKLSIQKNFLSEEQISKIQENYIKMLNQIKESQEKKYAKVYLSNIDLEYIRKEFHKVK